MKEIDVFKLAEKLGFDVRGAELNNIVNSLVIINENCDAIPRFNSNKVIAYGNLDEKVSKIVTLCGQGLSDETFELAKNADLIVSSDVKHHLILKAVEANIKLLIVTHYSSEFYGFTKVYENLSKSLGVKTYLNVENKYL